MFCGCLQRSVDFMHNFVHQIVVLQSKFVLGSFSTQSADGFNVSFHAFLAIFNNFQKLIGYESRQYNLVLLCVLRRVKF